MCMHDEAAPHYIDMIDETTLGHRFIKQEFNQTPRIGWQIDPFGHSAVQAYLLGAEVEELVASSLACLVESTNNTSCGKTVTKFEQVTFSLFVVTMQIKVNLT
ncbi:hypothetical protein AQUCO_02800180v1 [Aquilegia coerulea]|uniref:Glycoside hydrolase family 38 N-terminal domain-containing protein n=1 Tax=Aquilegia coerulea TaxID=218851 RepID=A0A2G5D473_AQUCA|nr:hypothetical protein AQUCO_02800180v1 [Aquilegia coerulea]